MKHLAKYALSDKAPLPEKIIRYILHETLQVCIQLLTWCHGGWEISVQLCNRGCGICTITALFIAM